uniref:peptidylprolyl isomerase n=1 Tax=Paulinella longichromatophora TaxID=1708747 RepID=A0A2H4ZP30_9EUKA|nr:FKBP-type peptidyl-prolyl cis-trans isomerase (PPIase) [Paulinella longichromatophora]
MSEILISICAFGFFTLIALISQVARPSTFKKTINPSDTRNQSFQTTSKINNSEDSLEVDPDDPNPILFVMAPTTLNVDNSNKINPIANSQNFSSTNPNSISMKVDTAISEQKEQEQTESNQLSRPLNDEKFTLSGLIIKDLIVGTGSQANVGQILTVTYRGVFEDGTEFDKRYTHNPFTFSLGSGQVIRGWDEGLIGMKVGGERILVIPPSLGYGSRGAGLSIPPNTNLTYEVQLLEIKS